MHMKWTMVSRGARNSLHVRGHIPTARRGKLSGWQDWRCHVATFCGQMTTHQSCARGPINGAATPTQRCCACAYIRLYFGPLPPDRKSTRLNSSHSQISYAVFCLKKKIKRTIVAVFVLT